MCNLQAAENVTILYSDIQEVDRSSLRNYESGRHGETLRA